MEQKKAGVIASASLGDFFRGEVASASKRLHLTLTDLVEVYVVQLLCASAHVSELVMLHRDQPLGVMLYNAQHQPKAERLQILRQLGDLALYSAGYFQEALERSATSVSYYVSLGRCAYAQVASLSQTTKRSEAVPTMYKQMAERYDDLVALLNEVAIVARQRNEKHTDLVKLYERYSRTKSPHLRRELMGRGLVLQEQANLSIQN